MDMFGYNMLWCATPSGYNGQLNGLNLATAFHRLARCTSEQQIPEASKDGEHPQYIQLVSRHILDICAFEYRRISRMVEMVQGDLEINAHAPAQLFP